MEGDKKMKISKLFLIAGVSLISMNMAAQQKPQQNKQQSPPQNGQQNPPQNGQMNPQQNLQHNTQQNPQQKNELDKAHEMKTYQLVLLKKGPNKNMDSTMVVKLQELHMAHLNKMANSGKMDICGPLTDEGDIRGICIYNVATKREAEMLANEDPMVKSGRLIIEVHEFYSAKGATLK
jgi:uncharacterized protein YciI